MTHGVTLIFSVTKNIYKTELHASLAYIQVRFTDIGLTKSHYVEKLVSETLSKYLSNHSNRC